MHNHLRVKESLFTNIIVELMTAASYYFAFSRYVVSYRSSQMHLPIVFPLFPENRNSIP